MKGKPTWKPHGLRAKRWREAAYTRGPAVLPVTKQETRGTRGLPKLRGRKAVLEVPPEIRPV
jgi:hypothetical protein